MAFVIATGKCAMANIIPLIMGNQLPYIPAKTTKRNPIDKTTDNPMILFNGLSLDDVVEFIFYVCLFSNLLKLDL